jgi:hypothetical protein
MRNTFTFLQKVQAGLVVDHYRCDPENIYVSGLPGSEEEYLMFRYCVEKALIKVGCYDFVFDSQIYHLTTIGESEFQKLNPKPNLVPLSTLLSQKE